MIVKFVEENSVTVVPSSWIKEKDGEHVCAWPPFKNIDRLDNAVKKNESPKPTWQWYKVIIMKSTETYEKGLQYEEAALYKSDLGTECEELENAYKKRNLKRKKNAQICEYSSEDEETHSKLPPFPHLKKTQQNQDSSFNSQPAESNLTENINRITTSFFSHSQPQQALNYQDPSNVAGPSHIISPPEKFLQPVYSLPLQTGPEKIAAHTPVRGKENREEGFQRKVLRMMEEIRQDIKDIKESITFSRSPLPQLPPGCPKLPCQFPEDLAELNAILENEDLFNGICDYLSTIGGSCVKDCTRRVLQKLVSNQLSLRYNWKGTRGEKLAFSVFTGVTKLILGVVRSNQMASSATELEVHEIIKKWLMHSKDREGGRNARAATALNIDYLKHNF